MEKNRFHEQSKLFSARTSRRDLLSAFDNGLPPPRRSFQLDSLHLVMINIKTTVEKVEIFGCCEMRSEGI